MKTKIIEINRKQYKKTWHDTFKIRKVGTDEVYDEAIDLPTSHFEYELTDIPIEQVENEEV